MDMLHAMWQVLRYCTGQGRMDRDNGVGAAPGKGKIPYLPSSAMVCSRTSTNQQDVWGHKGGINPSLGGILGEAIPVLGRI